MQCVNGSASWTSWTDKLDGPAGRISWTDQLDGLAGQTSSFYLKPWPVCIPPLKSTLEMDFVNFVFKGA